VGDVVSAQAVTTTVLLHAALDWIWYHPICKAENPCVGKLQEYSMPWRCLLFLSPETRPSCIISLIYWMTSAVMLRIVTIEKVDSVDIAL